MREQREEEYETGPPLPPKPDGCDDYGGDKRKRERMRDRAMGEERRIGELHWRPEHVDIRQRRAGRNCHAHSGGGRPPLSPGTNREANRGMGNRGRHVCSEARVSGRDDSEHGLLAETPLVLGDNGDDR